MADSEQKNQSPEKSAIALREETILDFWNKEQIFQKSLDKAAPNGEFIFYDGPPFATGTPHYGHILAGTIKDVIPRYKTMQGFHVPRVWGWDCHGLPIENMIEKELGLKNKKDIEDYGIEKFNEAARASVLRYDHEWKEIVPRTGRWIDMDHAYLTMDVNYSESIWWSFKKLHDKKLIYQGFKVMQLCPHCETTLSNFEVTQGYKDITDLSVYVKFELVDEPGTFVIAWTTTPWTLPGNVALAVNPEVTYVVADIKGEKVIVAKERLAVIKDEYTVVKEFSGVELVGKKYKPVFPYYADAELPNKENAWKIVGADFVTVTDGTGVVHIAPAFGEDDYNLSLKEKLPFVQHVTFQGTFKKEVTDFAGQAVKPKQSAEEPQAHQKADIEIVKYLAAHGILFAKEKFVHSYPHCWRCDTPLLNYATSSWFVKVTDIKDKLVAENKKVNWVPKEIGEGRFGKWLEGAKDWAISRSRFWGAPLPVWICTGCEKQEIVGSIDELVEKSGKEPKNRKGERDVHRPYIDEVSWTCSCGGTYKRVPEVFDTWYESGSMTYSRIHYPFQNAESIDKNTLFPADFIAEGQDQTRGWFYSLLVLSTALFDQSPYKSVVVNGTILAEDGQKMSKRLQNYPDVRYVLDKYGADAMRYYLIASPVVKAEDLAFTERGLDEAVKKLILRLDNVYTFYKTYQAEAQENLKNSSNVLDLWIMARLAELTKTVTENLDSLQLDRAVKPFGQFIDDLSTWYLRRSRDRFKGDDAADKQAALATTRTVLFELSKILAPIMPFFAEELYQKVKSSSDKESVHLESWPSIQAVDEKVISEMAEVRNLVSLALEARAKVGIKVRQPLQKLVLRDEAIQANPQYNLLIQDEVNVKEVVADAKIPEQLMLDTTLTPELKREGQARELIRTIQEFRKNSKLNPTDIIALTITTSAPGKELIETFKADIMKTAQLSAINLKDKTADSAEEIMIDDLGFSFSL
jgi:isoleucyl-tRNA synthetase